MTTPTYGTSPAETPVPVPAPPVPLAPPHSPIPGPNILLLGDSGTGKTHSIGTLVADFKDGLWVPKPSPHMEVFTVFTEPGMEVLSTLPCSHLHWTFIPPARSTWKTMIDVQRKVNTLSPKALAELPDMHKSDYQAFLQLLSAFENYTCDKCGKSFGDVTTWNTNRVLSLDSMSGLAVMAMQHVVGGKPTKSLGNWGTAMDGIESLILKLTMDTRCFFVMVSHQERELDEITGVQTVMVSTLGRKLAPKIPRFFSEVVQCNRQSSDFFWTTATVNTSTKTRYLPLSPKLTPDMGLIVEGWLKAGGILET